MPRVKKFNEEEVLQKAVELFWKKGFHATSMQDLVADLGINRASLYDTFGGKQALFNKAFQSYRDKSFAATKSFLDSFDSVKEALFCLLENAVTSALNDPDHKGCFTVNTATSSYPSEYSESICLEENRLLYEKIFADQIRKGMASGEISKEKKPEKIGMLLFVLLSGVNVIAKMNPNREMLLASIRESLSILD